VDAIPCAVRRRVSCVGYRTDKRTVVLASVQAGEEDHSVLDRPVSSFQLVRVGPESRFKLCGEVDLAVADGLFVLLQQSVDGARDLSLDLSDLRFIDCTGLRTLIQVATTGQRCYRWGSFEGVRVIFADRSPGRRCSAPSS
jgi:ABC-type transporter Mla MlaB component